jgi:hypothetical protein
MRITPDREASNDITGVREQAIHRKETSLGVLKRFGSGIGWTPLPGSRVATPGIQNGNPFTE